MKKENIVVGKKPILYRHFNKIGELLYVGTSISALHRLGEHSRNSKWFNTITTITLEHFKTIQEAQNAERTAIWFEHPKHNIQHSQNRKKLASILQAPCIPEDYIPDDMTNTHFRLCHLMHYSSLTEKLIYRLIEHDGFPVGRLMGSYTLWPIEEIQAWFDERMVNKVCKK
jgi:predicted DNA-binding transcriptional regulator AlpA